MVETKEIKKKNIDIDSIRFKSKEWDEEHWGVSLKLYEKEGSNNITLPVLSELNYALSKLEDLYNYLGKAIERSTGESNGQQLERLLFLTESIQETIDEAYQIPSKQELIDTIKECLDTLDSVDEEKEIWQKRVFELEDKYEPEDLD